MLFPLFRRNNVRKHEKHTDVHRSHLSVKNVPNPASNQEVTGMSGSVKQVRNGVKEVSFPGLNLSLISVLSLVLLEVQDLSLSSGVYSQTAQQ